MTTPQLRVHTALAEAWSLVPTTRVGQLTMKNNFIYRGSDTVP